MLIRNTAISVLLLSTLSLTGCATPRQVQFDKEVDRLCAIDGGNHINETVALLPNEFRNDGIPAFYQADAGELAFGPRYKVLMNSSVIAGAADGFQGASLLKSTLEIYRSDTGKLIGYSIHYIRRGGDIPLGGHPSAYMCPLGDEHLFKKIFVIKKN